MTNIRKAHPQTLAAVKSGVVVSLIETLLTMDDELKNSIAPGSYAVTLAAPGGIRNTASINGGQKGLTLKFFSAEGMVETLSGGKAPLLPLPTSGNFLKALKAFGACAGAVGKAMDHVPEEGDAEGIHKKTRLLMTAAFRGVCEVYNYDHWIKLKSASIPEGSIAVLVKDQPELAGTIILKGKKMTFTAGADSASANAVFEFADTNVCYGVLSGKLAAMGELGSGRVMPKGKLSMIQGLFPLLDRFGELMK